MSTLCSHSNLANHISVMKACRRVIHVDTLFFMRFSWCDYDKEVLHAFDMEKKGEFWWLHLWGVIKKITHEYQAILSFHYINFRL